MKRFLPCILSVFCLFVPHGGGAAGQFDFERISIGQGISQSDVTAILQDSVGFMWLATNNGLNRYDGYSFRTFKFDSRNPRTLSSSIIFSMVRDGGRYLWVSTKDAIDRYDAYTERFEHYTRAEDLHGGTVPVSRVTAMCMTSRGELWGVMRGYVLRLDRKSDKFRAYTLTNTLTNSKLIVLNCITEGPDGGLLVGTNRGVYCVDGESGEGRLLFNAEVSLKGRAPRVLSLMADPTQGLVYAGCDDGMFVIDSRGRFVREIRHQGDQIAKASAIMKDSFGRLWIATRERGIYIAEGDRVTNCVHDPLDGASIGSNYVLSLYEDLSGAVWVGTSAGGVNKVLLHRRPFHNIRHLPNTANSLSDGVVFAIYVDDDGTIWAATKDGVLNSVNPATEAVRRYSLPVAGSYGGDLVKIYGIERKGADKLWLATSHGLCLFDKATGRFDRSPVAGLEPGIRMRSMLYDEEGLLWLLSRSSGIYIIDGQRLVRRYNVAGGLLTDDFVRGICQDHRGDIWVGTRGSGVSVFRREGDEYAISSMRNRPDDPASLSLDNISTVYEDSRNRLWIGTWGGGLNLVTDREKFDVKVYTEQEGLCDNAIFGIFEDKAGKLWISSYNGLSCFDPDSEQFRNYTTEDGLPSNEFMIGAAFRAPDGRMLFGTINGLTMFHPEQVGREYPSTERLAVVKLIVGDREVLPGEAIGKRVILQRPISVTGHITLSHREQTFGLEMATFSFGAPGRTKFAYKLEGLDEKWNYSTRGNYVSYTNLRPGRYTFVFKAASSDGIWSEMPGRLEITITPPFWASPLAYVIYALLALTAALAAALMVRRKQEQRAERLREAMHHENEQALYQAKMKFFTNISHELRTPLALTLGLVERINDKLGGQNPVSRQLEVVKRNTDRLLGLVNDLLDMRNIETGNVKLRPKTKDIVAFTKTVWSYFESEAESKGISVFFDAQPGHYRVTIDFEKSEKILYNLLANAIKFTSTFIEIVIRQEFRAGREYIAITIRDDGPGISEDEYEKIFYRFYQSKNTSSQYTGSGLGLNFALEMTRLQQGELTVTSDLGKGSAFCLSLPTDVTQGAHGRDNMPAEDAGDSAPDAQRHAGDDKRPLILVVDDNGDMRYNLREALGDHYRVAEADGGNAAIALAHEMKPDLILCDVMMPDMDGIEVCRRLKESAATRMIPVILATARLSEESRVEGLRRGADAYIIKPFTGEHLRAQVANILEGRKEMRSDISRQIISTPQGVEVFSTQDKLLSRVAALLEKNIANPDYDVDTLSADLYISRVHLYRQLKAIMGLSPSDFIRDFRLSRAAAILRQNKLDISEVTYMTGFSTPKYFSVCFKKKYGMTPMEYAASAASIPDNEE